MKFSYRLLAGNGFIESLEHGPSYELTDAVINFKLFEIIDKSNGICVPWVRLHGIEYKPQSILLISSELDIPQFAVINTILLFSNKRIGFYYNLLITYNLDLHLRAYLVAKTTKYDLIYLDQLISKNCSTLHKSLNGNLYVYV